MTVTTKKKKTVLHYYLQSTNLPKQNALLKKESRKLASKIFSYVLPSRLQTYESAFLVIFQSDRS